jgi:hypothetical protein
MTVTPGTGIKEMKNSYQGLENDNDCVRNPLTIRMPNTLEIDNEIREKPYYFACTSRIIITVLLIVTSTIVISLITLIPCIIGESINSVFHYSPEELASFYEQKGGLSNKTYKVVLLGDSLIGKPFERFELDQKIKAYLPKYNLDIVRCAENGARIAGIRDTIMPECALPATPDAVILFWDSDCSDVSEDNMDSEGVDETRTAYLKAVVDTISKLTQTGVFVAIAGPGVLGEGAKLFAPKEERFQNKEEMLDDYSAMNKQVANLFKIPYIDIRAAFMAYVPSYQLCYSLCVTIDGEHENERGTKIVAKHFADTLGLWLSSL